MPARRGPGRPAGSKSSERTGTTRRARPATSKAKVKAKAVTAAKPVRPKGSGERAARALSLVTRQPGITIPKIAAKMKIEQNYLYRVLPSLEQEGKIRENVAAGTPPHSRPNE